MADQSSIPAWRVFSIGAAVTLVGAAVWWIVWFAGSSDRELERRTKELTCELLGQRTCDLPSSFPIGPVILTGVGAFILLLSAIVYAGRDRG